MELLHTRRPVYVVCVYAMQSNRLRVPNGYIYESGHTPHHTRTCTHVQHNHPSIVSCDAAATNRKTPALSQPVRLEQVTISTCALVCVHACVRIGARCRGCSCLHSHGAVQLVRQTHRLTHAHRRHRGQQQLSGSICLSASLSVRVCRSAKTLSHLIR